MPLGVVFALVSYGLYSCGDAVVKSFSGELGIFEIGFFANVFALLPAVFAKPRGEHWRQAFRLSAPLLMHIRGVTALTSSIAITYSFTTIPLAEAYSIAFLNPVFLTVLSVVVLKERVTLDRWLLVALSFVGVLVVVRPGFRELHWGHLTALVAAFAGAASTTILRMVSGREKKLSIVAMNGAYQIIGAGILMVFTFQMLTPMEFFRLMSIGLLGGTAQLLIITSLQHTPASAVAPLQYSQILWAVTFGSLFYAEFPDQVGLFGLAVVVLAGIATVFADGARTRIAGRWSEFRARREGPKFTEVEGPEI
ncbi:MAG: DMT family transporter [Devosia sp.]|jgi:drug/metabolite transporter (DMT)-like permease